MQINMPLLPFTVDVRTRPLPPFRFSLLHLMIAVALSGLLFGSFARLRQLDQARADHQRREMEELQRLRTPSIKWI